MEKFLSKTSNLKKRRALSMKNARVTPAEITPRPISATFSYQERFSPIALTPFIISIFTPRLSPESAQPLKREQSTPFTRRCSKTTKKTFPLRRVNIFQSTGRTAKTKIFQGSDRSEPQYQIDTPLSDMLF